MLLITVLCFSGPQRWAGWCFAILGASVTLSFVQLVEHLQKMLVPVPLTVIRLTKQKKTVLPLLLGPATLQLAFQHVASPAFH